MKVGGVSVDMWVGVALGAIGALGGAAMVDTKAPSGGRQLTFPTSPATVRLVGCLGRVGFVPVGRGEFTPLTLPESLAQIDQCLEPWWDDDGPSEPAGLPVAAHMHRELGGFIAAAGVGLGDGLVLEDPSSRRRFMGDYLVRDLNEMHYAIELADSIEWGAQLLESEPELWRRHVEGNLHALVGAAAR